MPGVGRGLGGLGCGTGQAAGAAQNQELALSQLGAAGAGAAGQLPDEDWAEVGGEEQGDDDFGIENFDE